MSTTAKRFTAREVANESLILTQAETLALISLSRDYVWKLRRSGDFPQPLDLGSRLLRWRRADIERWVEEREARRRPH